MSKLLLSVAGRAVEIEQNYGNLMDAFARPTEGGEGDFSVSISPRDLEYERMKAAREDELEGLPVREYSDAYLESTAIQRKITEKFFEYDILLFHGSVVAVDGVAYLFTAKSGTGKSTHTRLWRELLGDRAVMVNDDKPFLRFEGDQIIACGSPWNGKHRLGSNIMVPLKAICVLERGTENRITRIDAREALPMLFQQSARPRNPRLMPKYMELLDRLAACAAFYRLECNMNPEAAKMSFQAMSEGL
ncbi:MAG: hypothetical protein IJ960_02895 [Oscillospiraceae bacterium]|nr:hypothetical protein [Oscillospiraceae bacterium]